MDIVSILSQVSLGFFGIMPGNYSGITHIEGNQYAIVDDKDPTDGFKILTLEIDSISAEITSAKLMEPSGMARRRQENAGIYRDCEGIAYCDARNTIFVSGEEDQRILEYSLNGMPTGRELKIPSCFARKAIRSNLGFEALAYNKADGSFWTTTESTLKADGAAASVQESSVRNRLRLQSFGQDLMPMAQYAYEMDAPLARKKNGTLTHGVPSLLSLDDGRLVVMEREAYVSNKKLGSYCHIKLYTINPSEMPKISEETDIKRLPSYLLAQKTLLTEFDTSLNLGSLNFANYEGMCQGPTLADGRRTIILIADSQNGAGNTLFRLKDYVRIVII